MRKMEFVPTVDIGFGLAMDGVMHRIAANTPETRAELEAVEDPEKALTVLFGKDGCDAIMQAVSEGVCHLTTVVNASVQLFYEESNMREVN